MSAQLTELFLTQAILRTQGQMGRCPSRLSPDPKNENCYPVAVDYCGHASASLKFGGFRIYRMPASSRAMLLLGTCLGRMFRGPCADPQAIRRVGQFCVARRENFGCLTRILVQYALPHTVHDITKLYLFFGVLNFPDIIQNGTEANVLRAKRGIHFDYERADSLLQVRRRHLQQAV